MANQMPQDQQKVPPAQQPTKSVFQNIPQVNQSNPNPGTNPIQAGAQPTSPANPVMPEKKSVFKRWWFWMIIIFVLIGGGAGAYFYL